MRVSQKKKARAAEIKFLAFLLAIFLGGGAVGGTITAAVSHKPAPEETTAVTISEAPEQNAATEPRYIYYNVPLADDLQEYTQDLCKEHGIQYELALALMSAETDYRTNIISKTNDYGIMQINKINHERLSKTLGITDYLDPEQNIRAGIYMLSEIAENYDTPQEILMVYNRGHAGAKKLWKQGITTTKYTNRVLERMKILERR